MKKLKFLLFFPLALSVSLSAQVRYFDEIFANVEVTADVTYSVNATVLLLPQVGQAIPQELKVDIYEPTGDTEVARPLVIIMHTGNFLPPQVNGGCSGTRKDATDVYLATRLAKMGFVAAVADYRLGWNPVAGTQTERVYTLINAAYRGVQDSRTAIRFFRKSHASGNEYGIDQSKITLWGIGTGGYIALASATLDTITDTYVPKFFVNGVPMVIEPFSGNVDGTTIGRIPDGGVPGLPYPGGDTLNYPNHVGFSSEFGLAVNLGGALGDASWIDEDDVPVISYHVPSDPFAPCGVGIVNVPPPVNLPVVEVIGSCGAQPLINSAGLNDAMISAGLNDWLSLRARSTNGNIEGFYPFNGLPVSESSPWGFASSPNPYGLATDPMCETFATTHDNYIDTILRYFSPRACAVFNLSANCALLNSTTNLSASQVGMSAVPNPADDYFTLSTDAQFVMQQVELVDIAGRVCATFNDVNSNQFTVLRQGVAPGVYFARVTFREGMVTQKVILR